MTTQISLVVVNNEPRVDSRVIAEQLGITHQQVREIIQQYQSDFEEFGVFRFETGKPPKGSLGGRPERFAYLNEDQAYLLLSYSQNTPQARELKKRLVRAFSDLRKGKKPTVDLSLPALASHTVRANQVSHSKDVNAVLMEQGGRNAIVAYNTKNCTEQSGKPPQEWKRVGKAMGLSSKQCASAKDVLRVQRPQVACGMSLSDQLITGGASVEDGISIGKDSQSLFQRILALGITPPELLL